MDSLSQLLESLEVKAEVFYNGKLCGLQGFDENPQSGMLHFVKSGAIQVKTEEGHKLSLPSSSLLFFPSGVKHDVFVAQNQEAELVCASIHFPITQQNFLLSKLPRFICMQTKENPEIVTTTAWLFKEAFVEATGYRTLINRLCDIFMVQLIRHVTDTGVIHFSLLAGASHPKLNPLMDKLKFSPEDAWTVDSMAQEVAMSRSKFAQLFKETTGKAPMEYLTDLRLDAAKRLLKKQKPVGLIANHVGYENASTLARVFKKRFGVTPKQWIKR
ncbi:helix-turn-helix domain-containing protein [Marinagarivorans cellulosilyticus]|uniref:HTH araC/xylS-type domain-containing protein n=1 Tax=Marinagarivorans cellulosilyticus TaxID=2721545 RepID=A0AAN1WF63_9GAMM|nr:AraC family transcriptional regulator [Marinagarivorans cellulosilyticus]BCD96479.1 hypothetical protein MARGE09_P0679 [Marinagarivorans cellulosilyticus]